MAKQSTTLCGCGCGEFTSLARDNDAKRGYVKGQPLRYRAGHAARVKAADEVAARFFARIRRTDSCWEWTGSKTRYGYGRMELAGRVLAVHRWSYEYHVGPIPDGLVIDHLCRVRHCVNPDHLEPVTNAENLRRGLAGMRTHCKQGHEYTPDNTRLERNTPSGQPHRVCRECKNAAVRASRARKKAASKAPLATGEVLAGIRATRDADQRTRLDALLRRWATC